MTPELFFQTVVNATYAASYMALIAVGLVLIFGVMGVINFAHGELYMAGAYTVVALYAGQGFPFFVAVAIGLVFVGLLGLLMEYALFRPLRDNPLGGLIASIGFLLILQAVAVLGFGVQMEQVPPSTQEPRWCSRTAQCSPISGSTSSLPRWCCCRRCGCSCAGASSAGRSAPARRTPRQPRYKASRSTTRRGSPCSSGRLSPASPAPSPRPSWRRRRMGHPVIITAFIIIIVGGVGSLEGAVLAAILYGFVHTFVTTIYDGTLANIVGLLLMLMVLIVRPTGLFGAKERA